MRTTGCSITCRRRRPVVQRGRHAGGKSTLELAGMYLYDITIPAGFSELSNARRLHRSGRHHQRSVGPGGWARACRCMWCRRGAGADGSPHRSSITPRLDSSSRSASASRSPPSALGTARCAAISPRRLTSTPQQPAFPALPDVRDYGQIEAVSQDAAGRGAPGDAAAAYQETRHALFTGAAVRAERRRTVGDGRRVELAIQQQGRARARCSTSTTSCISTASRGATPSRPARSSAMTRGTRGTDDGMLRPLGVQHQRIRPHLQRARVAEKKDADPEVRVKLYPRRQEIAATVSNDGRERLKITARRQRVSTSAPRPQDRLRCLAAHDR